MKTVPEGFRAPCPTPGTVTSLAYGARHVLLYTPAREAERILYLIHGGGGDQHAFFCPDFLNMVDHMIKLRLLMWRQRNAGKRHERLGLPGAMLAASLFILSFSSGCYPTRYARR